MSRLPGHVRATLYGTFTCGCGCYYFITSASKKGRPSCGGVHGLDLSDRRSWSTPGAVKRKFHYADFATKIADFVATIWTCRDALKARNFFMTSPFRGPRPRLSLVKIGVMESGLNCGKVQQQLFKPLLASVTSRSRLGMQALTAREWRCRTLRQLMLLQQLLVYPASETLL